jgi:hypothetical protein
LIAQKAGSVGFAIIIEEVTDWLKYRFQKLYTFLGNASFETFLVNLYWPSDPNLSKLRLLITTLII